MRVFISNVDSPIGHILSRLLANTIVGSRRPGGDDDQDNNATNAINDNDNATENAGEKQDTKPAKETYAVVGSFLPPLPSAEALDRSSSLPGQMVYTGDRKKDAARKLAIEKFAVRGQAPKWVHQVIEPSNRAKVEAALLNSDVIIYDLLQSVDEAEWAIEMLNERAETFAEKPKVFIGISTVMTWARTKGDADDPDTFVTEDEYRRRKSHPNFKKHNAVEKLIIKYGKKSSFKAYVVGAGLVYHAGESIFHYILKAAWQNAPGIPCYGDGANILPTIHLEDLCNIVVEIIETTPDNHFFLAIDDAKSSLFDITKAISDTLGNGKVAKVPKEQALLQRDVTQADYDMLLANLHLEPGRVKEMSFEWVSEAGLVDNVNQLVDEYRDARGLHPLKVVVHGPPASGKTAYAKRIAEHYEIHYLDVHETVQTAIDRLERRVAGTLTEADAEDDIEADKELLSDLKSAAAANDGKYPEDRVVAFLKDKLSSPPCRNQGFVLDGYPTTAEEALQLFKIMDDPSEHDLMPEFVIALEVSDEFIKNRIMNLPESATAGTKNSEEAITRRLAEYRTLNTEENTILNFFDEQEVHPLVVNAETESPGTVMTQILARIGKPRNYGPTIEELARRRIASEAAKVADTARMEADRAEREKEEGERHLKAVADWNARLEEIRKQEQEVLEAQSVPLRNYLMKHVMPTLTTGLIEVCKVRPEDPIDYLAEFLFRQNPSSRYLGVASMDLKTVRFPSCPMIRASSSLKVDVSASIFRHSKPWRSPSTFSRRLGPPLIFSYSNARKSSTSIPMSSTSTISNEAANIKSTAIAATLNADTVPIERITRPIVGYWYLFSGCLVFGIVVLGGLTRLTESGLSIVEWNLFRGMKPPTSQAEWDEEFAKYKTSPEYQLMNRRMTLDEFKFIFYMEWAHRMWGRAIGLSFIIPGVFFASRGYMSRGIKRVSLVVGSLIGCQGVLGWYMVKSGLKEELLHTPGAVPRVSPYWLAAHLGSAFVIYSLMMTTGWRILRSSRAKALDRMMTMLRNPVLNPMRQYAHVTSAMVFFTAISGAFVAGLDAGLVYNQWPKMGLGYFPTDYQAPGKPWWRNIFENPAAAQFDHRILAYATFTAISALWLYSRRLPLPRQAKVAVNLLMGVACIQVTLGISTLIYFVPIPLAAAHQAGSLTLLTSALWLMHILKAVPK
ncbi:adenylate kinase [Synchytrium endobioticum]|uniref:Adenylate kinase n=1 Tax=Synchytrium endobioticum TaxID=286115 RepID=A0A507DB50_9FUNG|nr:adenylate kinase [Synchytrium endobioticum]